jgi:hypothetical protein
MHTRPRLDMMGTTDTYHPSLRTAGTSTHLASAVVA